MGSRRAWEKGNHVTELILCSQDTSSAAPKAAEKKQTNQPRRAGVVHLRGEARGGGQGRVSHQPLG